MIAGLFPSSVASETSFGDIAAELPPAEASYVARAVPSRRAEFTTGRVCARRCLDRLDLSAVAIPPDPRGAPCWPAGVVGSITHCRGFRGAVVARTTTHLALGVDCEPDESLPAGTVDDIARPEERRWLRSGRFTVHADRLLFSAKEAVYKSWYPLTGRWLDFHDVRIEFGERGFTAHVLIDLDDREELLLRTIPGRWTAADGFVATATEIPRQERNGPQ